MAKFVRRSRPIYWWPVTVQIPSEKKPGEFEKQILKMRFEPLLADEKEAHDQDMSVRFPEGGWKTDVELLKRVVKDWGDYDDENGNAIPFSEDELVAACQHQNFRLAAAVAYIDSLNGPLARRGN